MRFLLFFAINIVFVACKPVYEVNKKYFYSSKPVKSFVLEKIIVDSVYTQNRKSEYYIDSTDSLKKRKATKKGFPVSYSSDTAVILINAVNDNSLKKIYFNKKIF